MDTIEKVTLVSDGLVVEFGDGTIYYFPAKSLYAHKSELESQRLVKADSADSIDLEENRELEQTTASIVEFVPRHHE